MQITFCIRSYIYSLSRITSGNGQDVKWSLYKKGRPTYFYIIKWRVIEDYNKLSGNFKSRLNNLSDQYTKQYGNSEDDGYRKYVKVILLYMFEQCLIGKKIDKEI